MAQLKDSVVSGNLRVTDTTLTDTLGVDTIKAPSSSNSSTLGVGTNGQVLKSNGTSTYWGSESGITGVSFNGTAATVSNGIASITDRQVITLTWDSNDYLSFPSGVSPSTLPACGVPIILKGDGFVNALTAIDGKYADYCVVTLFEYEPEDSVEEYGQWIGISAMAQCGPILYSIVAEFETPFGSNFFEKTQFYKNELFYSGSIATSFYNGSVTDNMVPGALLMWNTLQALPQILSGTSDPTSAQGNNGDIYIKLSS